MTPTATPTSVPWAVYQAGAYRHPVQLYELALDLALFAFLWRRRRVAFRDGELFGIYIVAYARDPVPPRVPALPAHAAGPRSG